ncbi:MAG: alanine--glyoxylate aminotransferase family protein [Thermoplasmata archaeon]
MDYEDTTLMLAGPVKIHPRVLKVMSTPSIGHRTSHFREVCLEIRDLLRYAFDTEGAVAVISGSGTAGLEAMLCSTLRVDDRVLCITNGKFGERMYEIASLYSQADQLDFPWGKAMNLQVLKERLDADAYRAVTLCHNETSTAATNLASEVGKLARRDGLLYLVDGITSVGGLPVEMEAWGIDGIVLGSQKCLAAPAGLSAVALSERGYEVLRDGTPYYLDLKAHVDRLEKGDTPYTPAIHLLLAFREALRMLREEGLRSRIERTALLGRACREAGRAIGLSLYPDLECASDTLSAFWYPDGVKDEQFRPRLRDEHRVMVAGGQGSIRGRVFRIGHMGVCSLSDLLVTFAAVEAVLDKIGHPVQKGASLEAISRLVV